MAQLTTIDNIPIATYNAVLVEYSVSQNKIKNNVMEMSHSYKPIPLNGEIGVKKICLVMDFSNGTGTENNAENKISDLIGYLVGRSNSGAYLEIDVGDGFGYTCVFESASDPVEKAPWIKQSAFYFMGFRHRDKISRTATNKHYLTITSSPRCDITSPLRIKFTPNSGVTDFCITYGGETQSTQKIIKCQGISSYIEFDTLYGTVKDSAGNAFHKTNMIEFPKFVGNSTVVFLSHNYAHTEYVNGNLEFDIIPVTY